MRALVAVVLGSILAVGAAGANEPVPLQADPGLANPAIDMPAFLGLTREAAALRETHRVTEAEFLRLSRQPGTVVLDARSQEKYDLLHVRGALHLDFSDIAVASLERLIPDRSTRILIYCNNNFSGAEDPFPSKLPAASLNLSTYVALYTYGYRNVYELGPQIELARSHLEFDGRGR